MTSIPLRHAVLFATYASLSAPAYAYLDGATGSIVIQAVIGGVTTWLVYSRALGAKVKAFFRRRKGE